MNSRLLAYSDWFYRLLLKAYPAQFRERFADEMAQVFQMACRNAYAEAGAAGLVWLWLPMLLDWAWAAGYQWSLCLFKRKVGSMSNNFIDQKDGIDPMTLGQTALAVLPFLLFGLSSILLKLSIFLPVPGSFSSALPVLNAFLIFVILILAGLFAGLLAGFPRWGYSYLFWTIIMLLLFANIPWLLGVGVILAALLIRRSLQPLRRLLSGVWQDWTILSFTLYVFYSFVFMIYDENHNPYLYILITATTLALCLGAWGYFRAASPMRRVFSLVGGLFLAVIISIIDALTWDFAAYYDLPKSTTNINLVTLTFFVVMALIMIGNGLLAHWRSWRKGAVSN